MTSLPGTNFFHLRAYALLYGHAGIGLAYLQADRLQGLRAASSFQAQRRGAGRQRDEQSEASATWSAKSPATDRETKRFVEAEVA